MRIIIGIVSLQLIMVYIEEVTELFWKIYHKEWV